MKSARALVVVFALISWGTTEAQDAKWYQVSTEHFLLFTDTSEAKGEKLLSDFEKRVSAFELVFGKSRPRQFPIEVFLFKDHNDYVNAIPKLLPVDGVTPSEKNAYLLNGPDRTFIVAKDKSPEDISNDVAHALGHVLFEHEVMWRPFWLEEGISEYVRAVGRRADNKTVSSKDAFSVDDLLGIAPSATYQDSDSGGTFRLQSYRLFRVLLQEKPQALHDFVKAIDREDGENAKIDIDVDAIGKDLENYTDTAVPMPAESPTIRSAAADATVLAVHRGDALLAADKAYDASKYYNGNSSEARAARAILVRFSRAQTESLPALSRAAQDLPDNGLVQYHFGALSIEKGKEIDLQLAALQRAVKLLPDFGRAYAELARLDVLTGKANQAMPLLDKALALAPEYADHYYEIRANVLLALTRYDEAFASIKIAEALPHPDHKTAEAFTLKVSSVSRQIELAKRAVDGRQVERLRQEVEAKVNEREPVTPPAPVEPIRDGTISYQIAATTMLEVNNSVFPEYPESLRKLGKSGKINLRVVIAPDGTVRSAAVTSSELPDLNADTVESAKHWTFKMPAGRTTPATVTITFIYRLQ
jgi:TonB family protein